MLTAQQKSRMSQAWTRRFSVVAAIIAACGAGCVSVAANTRPSVAFSHWCWMVTGFFVVQAIWLYWPIKGTK